jgi:hypothetical protein
MIIRASIAMLAVLWTCAALSQEASMTEKFYQSLEPEFRGHYAKFWEGAEVEKARKAKAGEPAATASEWKLGITGAKTLLYNTAVTRALCAEQAGLPIKDEGAFERDMHHCLLDRMSEFRKFQKLIEYKGSISPSKSVRCEMKSRDYKNEMRFPPFDFLRTDGEPELQLMDHKALNGCLLSGP